MDTKALLDSLSELGSTPRWPRLTDEQRREIEFARYHKKQENIAKHEERARQTREQTLARDRKRKGEREKKQKNTQYKPNYKTCIKVMLSLGYTPLHSGTTSSVFHIVNRYIHIRRAPNKGLFWFSTDSEKPMYTHMVEAQGHRFSQLNRYLTELQA
jgi:hypothetical protein